MSHDETSGPVTRKERRAAYGGTMLGRKPAPRYTFSAAAHVREDWSVAHCIERLEYRAHGYNGILRSLFCTAAQRLRDLESALEGYRNQVVNNIMSNEEDRLAKDAETTRQLAVSMGMIPSKATEESFDRSQFDGWTHEQMVDAYVGVHKDREAYAAAETPEVSKRNQQPGRLSGGEREALKKFVVSVVAVGSNDDLMKEVMAEGRALLTKVRKRALGDQFEETVDCSALMPVGVEEGEAVQVAKRLPMTSGDPL